MKTLTVFSKGGRRAEARGDIPLLACVCLMVCFGCLMVYSASCYVGKVQYGDAFFFVKKQILGAVAGGAVMVVFCFFPYRRLYKFRYAAVIISVVLLLLVFVDAHVGVRPPPPLWGSSPCEAGQFCHPHGEQKRRYGPCRIY